MIPNNANSLGQTMLRLLRTALLLNEQFLTLTGHSEIDLD